MAAGNPRTGHREEIPPLALHPRSFTEREVARLLNDPDELRKHAVQQAETIGQADEAFREAIRSGEGRAI